MVEEALLDPSNSMLTESKRRTRWSRDRDREKESKEESVYLAKKMNQLFRLES